MPKVVPLTLFLDKVPCSSAYVTRALRIDVFVKDLFMCHLVSKQRKTSNIVGMPSFTCIQILKKQRSFYPSYILTGAPNGSFR